MADHRRSKLFCRTRIPGLVLIIVFPLIPSVIWAHGQIGDRFFPTTLTFDDPAVNDEFGSVLRHRKLPRGSQEILTTGVSIEYSKRLTPHWVLAVETEHRRLDQPGSGINDGFSNIGLGTKYSLFESAKHEYLITPVFEIELGDTGDRDVAEAFTVYSPGLSFGKGFGDIKGHRWRFARPFAVTGLIAGALPSQSSKPDTVTTAVAVQYSLPYLHAFVEDIGIGYPWRNLVPVVEVPITTCANQGCAGEVTATVNPGVMWLQRGIGQLGLEATFPINERSGSHVGLLFQIHLYLDEMFPTTIGAPLFPGLPHRH